MNAGRKIPIRATLVAFAMLACTAVLAAAFAGTRKNEPVKFDASVAANIAPTASDSRAAFLQVHKVFTSPRCQNCHPSGDAPLQGDDSHAHAQFVKRGRDGHGVYGMRCNTCHQEANTAGANMPPGNPKWGLPPPEHKMVFVGRTPAQLCRQLKDPKQTGGRSLAQLLTHVSSDDLVGWGWSPGNGRSLPPLSREDTVAQMKIWIDGGAACPE
jgi:cytochrome c5